jgi:uncharacterized lipoprotein YajG
MKNVTKLFCVAAIAMTLASCEKPRESIPQEIQQALPTQDVSLVKAHQSAGVDIYVMRDAVDSTIYVAAHTPKQLKITKLDKKHDENALFTIKKTLGDPADTYIISTEGQKVIGLRHTVQGIDFFQPAPLSPQNKGFNEHILNSTPYLTI